MKKYILLSLICISFMARGQNILVPTTFYFADQQIKLDDSGLKEIQKRVDGLHKYPRSFQARIELADTYFPIIERVFREEGLPDDFKYLVLIESGLISDAVSTSNAVGFWQFKKATATDYGLRVNDQVDERKHIIESSRSAARYLVKSNNLYYKNWHNTVLSYYHGFTGAKIYTRPEHQGKKEMEVTDKSDVYILKLLAHKIAYENFIGKNPLPAVLLQEVVASGKNISDVALEIQVPEAELQKYNKWILAQYIPNDKNYTVLVPVINAEQRIILASQRTSSPSVAATATPKPEIVVEKSGKREFKKLNGLKVIIAGRGDTKDKLAMQAKMSTRKFLSLNDMYSFDPIVEGEAYYIQRKNGKASVQYHVVKPGERVQQVAQKYGVRVKSILWNNRMKSNEVLATGRLLWMQHRRPANVPVEFQKVSPETPPTRLPANPVILAKDEVLDELNGTDASTSQMPDTAKNPKKEYAGGKLSGTSAAKSDVILDTEIEAANETIADAEPVAVPEKESNAPEKKEALTAPLDEAIAQTNENNQKTTEVLTENIDKQVETINKTEPVALYKKPVANTEIPVAGEVKAEVEKEETIRIDETLEVKNKPVVILREPASGNKKPIAKPVVKTPVMQAPKGSSPAISKVVEKEQPVAPVQQVPGIHVVAKGETLYAISKKYNITAEDIKIWNNLGDMPLSIGQNLKVIAPAVTSSTAPVGTTNTAMTEPAPGRAAIATSGTHTVAAGESMYQISRKYGVTIKDIMEWNNKPDFNVSPGERLHIKVKSSSN